MKRELREGMWKGSEAVLVGGGASLRGFDWERLAQWRAGRRVRSLEPARRVCVVNDGIVPDLVDGEYIPTCAAFADLLLWMDREQYDYRKEHYDVFRGLKCTMDFPGENRAPRDTVFLRTKAVEGVSGSIAEGLCHGNNSGYMLKNLVALLGSNPIYLLGYDGGPVDGRVHWHHAPRVSSALPDQEDRYGRMRGHFEASAYRYRELGVRVVNISPASRIQAFERMDPDEVLPRRVTAWA